MPTTYPIGLQQLRKRAKLQTRSAWLKNRLGKLSRNGRVQPLLDQPRLHRVEHDTDADNTKTTKTCCTWQPYRKTKCFHGRSAGSLNIFACLGYAPEGQPKREVGTKRGSRSRQLLSLRVEDPQEWIARHKIAASDHRLRSKSLLFMPMVTPSKWA